MNGLAFGASLVNSLAWPLAAVILGVIYRKPLTRLLERATRLKGPGVEFSFDAGLRILEARVEAENPAVLQSQRLEPGSGPNTQSDLLEQVERLAAVSPAAAVTFAWNRLEQRLRDYLAAQAPDEPLKPTAPVRDLLQALRRRGLVSSGNAAVLGTLRSLRNESAHARDAGEPTVDAAMEYAVIVHGFLGLIENGLIKRGEVEER